MSNKNNGGNIILPGGGRCLYCSNPQPCFAHTEVNMRTKDGQVIRYNNMPELLAALIGAVAELKARVDRLAAPRISIE